MPQYRGITEDQQDTKPCNRYPRNGEVIRLRGINAADRFFGGRCHVHLQCFYILPQRSSIAWYCYRIVFSKYRAQRSGLRVLSATSGRAPRWALLPQYRAQRSGPRVICHQRARPALCASPSISRRTNIAQNQYRAQRSEPRVLSATSGRVRAVRSATNITHNAAGRECYLPPASASRAVRFSVTWRKTRSKFPPRNLRIRSSE